ETACPSGVPYGHLLEATRATLTKRHRLPLIARAMLAVFASPRLMSLAMRLARALRASRVGALLARLLPGRIGFALTMLESTRVPISREPYEPRSNESRGSFALLEGCVMRGLYSATNDATCRTLEVNGYQQVPAAGQR